MSRQSCDVTVNVDVGHSNEKGPGIAPETPNQAALPGVLRTLPQPRCHNGEAQA